MLPARRRVSYAAPSDRMIPTKEHDVRQFTIDMYPYTGGPPRGEGHLVWRVFADSTEIGEIEYDGQDTYRGKLTGATYSSDGAAMTALTRDQARREDVFTFLVVQALFLAAKDRCDAIVLDPDDIKDVETGYPTIDGMLAWDWVLQMTAD